MRFQGTAFLIGVLIWNGAPVRAQQVSQTATPTVIRSETRLVLVDAVVTDKKGSYMPDLAQKNFKVFEDNKEQAITSFTYEADPASPNNNQKHYLVLFFDNASVGTGDQMQARQAAQKFVDSNTGPNKYIAVVNFSGTLRISQNFTNDADRLRDVIAGVKTSTVSTNDTTPGLSGGGGGSLNSVSSFGISSVLLGLRSLAKGLADTPGRKMVVMLTAGFPLNSEIRSELTATIDACNKSNVSVYPVDVRGLVAPAPGMMPGNGNGRGGRGNRPLAGLLAPFGSSSLSLGSFGNSFQARGGATGGSVGGGSTSGGTSSGGTTSGGASGSAGRGGTTSPGTGTGTSSTGVGGRGTTTSPGNTNSGGRGVGGTSAPVNPTMMNRNTTNPRNILPPMTGVNGNLDALYALAEGTGGFVIMNTNDLLGGMEKIAREQDQYYVIGFTPPESAEGSCHTLHVKVDKGGANVRSRSGYCNVRQVDVLAGKPAETELEALAVGATKGNLGSPLQLPFFYAAPNVARVNLAMEIPSQGFKFEKVKGKFHAEMNVLGIAYRADNSVGAKFSDTLKFDLDNQVAVDQFHKTPVHYESQFDVASGKYNFKVVFSAGGESFGKIEKPLEVEPFDGKQFAVSSLALAKELLKNDGDVGMDAVLIEDKVPLVALGKQAIPAAEYRFAQNDAPGIYLEIYDSALTDEKPPEIGFAIKISDLKTGAAKVDSGNLPLKQYVHPGNPMVPVILNLPVKDLAPGMYKLEIMGLDNTGKSMIRSAEFEVDAPKATALGWDKN